MLSSLIALVTLSATTIFNLDAMRKQLLLRVSDDLMARAAQTAASATSFLESQLSATSMVAVGATGDANALRQFARTQRDVIAASSWSVDAAGTVTPVEDIVTPYSDRPEFVGQDPQALPALARAAAAAWARDLAKDLPREPIFRRSKLTPGLPVLSLIVPARVRASKEARLLIVSLSEQRLAALLPSTGGALTGHLLDGNGTVAFSAAKAEDTKAWKLPTVYSDLPANTSAPVLRQWEVGKKRLVGVLAPLKSFPFRLYLEQDASGAFMEINSVLARSGLLALLFVFAAVLLTFFVASQLASRIRTLTHAALAVAAGQLDLRIPIKRRDELGLLAACMSFMAQQIRNLLQRTAQAAQLEKELETAQTIQTTLFPRLPDHTATGWSVSGSTVPASVCGGDWWFYFEGKQEYDVFIIGDVTGHGVSAAIVTGMAYAAGVAFMAEMAAGSSPASPAALLSAINRTLWVAGNGRGTTMTMFAFFLPRAGGEAIYSNAGHCPPFVVETGGEKANVKALSGFGDPLGFSQDSAYIDQRFAHKDGQTVVLYTDGLTECMNPADEEFGKLRLKKFLQRNAGMSPSDLREKVTTEVLGFADKRPFDDDCTIVALSIGASYTPDARLSA